MKPRSPSRTRVHLPLLLATLALLLYSCYTVIAPTDSFSSLYFKTLATFTDYTGSATFKPDPKHLVKAPNGAVACDIPICSEMGTKILQQNGTAADAAVTVALCIGLINFQSSGIGGGGFIVSKPFGQDAVAIDAREMAPLLSHKDMYNYKEHLAQLGGLAIAIPGELKGLDTLYQKHGSGNLQWADLLEPVIQLARKGWRINTSTALSLNSSEDYIVEHSLDDWKFVFHANGTIKSTGDYINRPALLDTLAALARNGSSDLFYDPEGAILKSLARKAVQKGGILTAEDFGKYKVRVSDALQTSFSKDKYTLFTANGASSGPALIAGINVMDQFEDHSGLQTQGHDFNLVESHRLVEVFKWAAALRSHLGDLNVYSTNKSEIEHHEKRYSKFQSLQWAKKTYLKINDSHTLPSWKDYKPAYAPNEPLGTSHFSIVDKYNNAVLMTTTVNLAFGSKVHDPATGVVLNNEMDDFSIPTAPNAFGLYPSIYNWVEPYKRPLSSTTPSIIINSATGRPDLVIGAAGGSLILTSVLQGIIRKYHYHLDVLDIIARPRLHHQLLPEMLFIEFPEVDSLVEGLEEKGHNVTMIRPRTAMNAILFNDKDGTWDAVSDFWRKGGLLYGY